MNSINIKRDGVHQTALGLFLGFIGVASFSLTLPMTRLAVSTIDAGTVAIWRGLIAAVAAAVILILFYRQWPGRRHIVPILTIGGGIVIGFPVFMTLAMQTIPASHGAIVIGLLPISTAGVSALTSRESPSKAFWGVSLLGTLLTLAFVFRLGGGGFELGHLYLIIAVIFGAIGYALGGQTAKELGAPRVICWALVFMAPLLIIAAFLVEPISWQPDEPAFQAFLYLALISQLAGFFAWYRGLAIGGVARVSQVQLLQIFMTLIASAVMLAEPVTLEIWTFSALVMICVAVSSKLRIKT